MDWQTPDPNVKVSLEISRDAMQVQVYYKSICSFESCRPRSQDVAHMKEV